MAHSVFHRSLTAGVAFAGAGAIAFSTLPVLPTQHAVSAVPQPVVAAVPFEAPRVVATDVELASLVSSLQILLSGAAGAVGESFAAFSTQMPAIFRQVQAQWADPDLTPLNHSLIAAAFFTPVAPLINGPFTDAVAEVLAQTFPSRGDDIREKLPEAVNYAFARLIGPIISAIGATGAVHQEIYAAGMAGNPPGQWLALLRAPFTVLDGFLNGGYGDISALLTGEVGGDRIAAPGLLTRWGQYPADRSVTDDWDGIPSEQSTVLATDTLVSASRAPEVVTIAVTEDGTDATDTAADDDTAADATSSDATDADTADADADTADADTADKDAADQDAAKTAETRDEDSAGKAESAGKPKRSADTDSTNSTDTADTADKADKGSAGSDSAE